MILLIKSNKIFYFLWNFLFNAYIKVLNLAVLILKCSHYVTVYVDVEWYSKIYNTLTKPIIQISLIKISYEEHYPTVTHQNHNFWYTCNRIDNDRNNLFLKY